jgi:raffinose/stachyose/melibiose transport system permease protein
MRDTRRSAVFWAFILGYLSLIIVPLALMLISSFRTNREIFRAPLALPSELHPENYLNAWDQAEFSTYIVNSLLVTGWSVALTVVLATLAAFPLSRYRLRFLPVVLGFFLIGLMLPVRLGIVPLFLLLRDLGLLDSHVGLILVYVAIRLPFAIFILTSFMRTIPMDLEEAARLDGAGDVRILRGILVPLVRPAIAIVVIFTLIAVWNDFFLPLIFIYSDELKTVPLGLTTFMGQYRSDWGLLFAGLTISSIPLVVAYLVFGRQMREGVAQGGMR